MIDDNQQILRHMAEELNVKQIKINDNVVFDRDVYPSGVIEVTNETRFADFTNVELMLLSKGQVGDDLKREINQQIEINRQEFKRDYRTEQLTEETTDD